MPYEAGRRLTAGESASKLGHLEVVQSPFVRSLIERFEYPPVDGDDHGADIWTDFNPDAVNPLTLVIAVDGSLQVIKSDGWPTRSLAFIKTALIRVDRRQMDRIDKELPHPVLMKALMKDSALQMATVLPLRHVRVPGLSNYELVRQIIRDSMIIESDGLVYKTLKWIAYQQWEPSARHPSPNFTCPHCANETSGLPYAADTGTCDDCGGDVHLADMIGFHLEMGEDQAPESLANAYMLIHETLLIFSVVRHFWERGDYGGLGSLLLIKDGPLMLPRQYSKLVPNIRAMLQHARDVGRQVHLIGQEKTGRFAEHLAEVERFARPKIKGDLSSYAILSHRYVRQEVDHAPERPNPYGLKTNYGEKVLVKMDPYTSMVLNVPTGNYGDSPDFPSSIRDLIGFDRIMRTLPALISYQHEGALMPVSLAHGVASLSSYPSAAVLKLFAGI